MMLTGGFARLVMLAALLACPLAYLLAEMWLERYAYRIDLGAGPFLASGLAALLLSVVTVGSQALRAARRPPVDALRVD